jgi:hypothetical protein
MSTVESYDDVEHLADDDTCQTCGGDGFVHDCIDGCCLDVEIGCDDCTRRCPDCAMEEYRRLRAERVAMLRALDVDRAIAFAKLTGRWRMTMSRLYVLGSMYVARSACPEFSEQERTDGACWAEGIL